MKEIDIEVFVKSLGHCIKDLRTKQEMTQLDLAIKSEIDVRQIQRLERGHTSATLKTLLKITSGLNINITELFKILQKENL